MIGGKRFRTLREAKRHQTEMKRIHRDVDIYNLVKANHVRGKPDRPRVYKYFVGTHLEWLNL